MTDSNKGAEYRFRSLLSECETHAKRITHDYENDPEEGSQHLNDLFSSADQLLAIQARVHGFVNERILPFLQ